METRSRLLSLNEIKKLNKKIYNITQLIEKIAFNTNTLALKAAIEAVRSGKRGSDFTVIATELRILAQNTSLALKGINQVLNDTIGKISKETDGLKQPGNNVNKIQTKIINLVNIFTDIYTIFTEIEEKTGQTSMNNNEQQNSFQDDRKKSPRESMSTRTKNFTGLNPYLNVKKPTLH